MSEVLQARELALAAAERTHHLLAVLRELDAHELEAPSELPGWSRLTIICHLRYGARALLRMTDDALAGRATSYYPGGRAHQRPGTLHPTPGERPGAVLDDWGRGAAELDERWASVTEPQWGIDVVEPTDNPDLGTVPLGRLALARLTEVDVHGTDLGIGAPDWSAALVAVGLPTRLRGLASRRTNHRTFDASISGSWLLESTGGLRWLVAVDGQHTTSRPAADDDDGMATIAGTDRDLMALLLGRPRRRALTLGGDTALAAAFELAFPGP